jgi:tRNA threonylcarbamoyladenosine biosynthesis protein TsaE
MHTRQRRSNATLRLHSPSPEVTERLGAALAAAIDADGAIVLLSGPLGAGKTRFVKGIASGLGFEASRVQSPTFVLAQELPLGDGRSLVHVDCYRVAGEAELESAGLFDWLAPGALLVAEWADRVPGAWPRDHLALRFTRGGDEFTRTLDASASGPRAKLLLARWRSAIDGEAAPRP